MGKELDLDDVAAQSPLATRELAELRENAQRYQYLRGNMTGVIHLLGMPAIGLSGVTGDDLDAILLMGVSGTTALVECKTLTGLHKPKPSR